MRRLVSLLAITLTIALSACGGPLSPPTAATAPSPLPAQAPHGAAASAEVRLVDAIAGIPAAGISVTVGSRAMPISDGDGCSTLSADRSGRYGVTFSGGGVVTRTTLLAIPAPEVQLSLIPAGFALAAFDEMFRSRNGQLGRWNAAPRLVVAGREVQFDPAYPGVLKVLSSALTDGERDDLVADLSYGFGILTDQRLGGFSSVATESPAAGASFNILRTGAIVVARSRGLTAATGYWGLGQWATAGNGEVAGGYMLLDADFDGPSCAYPQFRRSLRIHELGHALGYQHVTQVRSVMNGNARLEPTAWDLQAVHIAFQRLPGSTTPDNDPPPATAALRSGALTWASPIY